MRHRHSVTERAFLIRRAVTWAAVLVAVAVPGAFVASNQSQDTGTLRPPAAASDGGLPSLPIVSRPVETAETIQATYEFAALHPEVLRYIPCFCACGKTEGHLSNEDCFVSARSKSGGVVWNVHAAECHICIAVANHARQMYLAGHNVTSIRAEIDRVYGARYKRHTDTPMPPQTADGHRD